jgi:N-acetylneuraminate 9-O-acetyltransferase
VQVPGYQLSNFLICSLLYVGISRRLFMLTNVLKDAFVPRDNNAQLAQNAAVMAFSAIVLYVASYALHLFLYPVSVA